MPDLDFAVTGVAPVTFAMAPTLAFKLAITNRVPEEPIHNILLHCQIQIAATHRHYVAADQPGLRDLFGEPSRWKQTVRSLLWALTNTTVPRFTGTVSVDLHVPCSYDFNIASTKYFGALSDGLVPVTLLFSGTVFSARQDGCLQATQIPWEREATFQLPVAVWKEMMALYYPNATWLSLRQDVFDRLYQYKVQHGVPTWEQTLERLLPPEDH